ncbi:MAG: processing protein [Gaiellaceae bacterium]|nr:processing protein [Gaiellaceae bacterium]
MTALLAAELSRTELATAVFAAQTDAHLLDAPRLARFASFRATFDAEAFLRDLSARGLRWVARSDPAFPHRLRSIHDPPPGLFVRGTAALELLECPSVAVVGARACSQYGASVARMLGREVAAAGVLIVSGLARGVDAEAHRGALQSGATVAVLGCGIDRDYPRSHASLAAEIARDGLIVSEYPPGVEPAPWRFPARNRIVAGLALATVVVEARERSGALITADLALDEGRDVLAVPGEITSQLSRGTNHLLRLGAVPVTCVADVLRVLGVDPPPAHEPLALEPGLELVRVAVADAATTADELATATGQSAGVVAAALAELELLGVIQEVDGVYRTRP